MMAAGEFNLRAFLEYSYQAEADASHPLAIADQCDGGECVFGVEIGQHNYLVIYDLDQREGRPRSYAHGDMCADHRPWSLGGSDRFLFYAIQDGPDIALFEPQCFHDQALQISNDRGASPRSIITDNGESLPRSSRHNMVMDCIGRICLQSADALMASCSALWRICSKITPSNCQFRPVLPDSARHNSTMARCSVFWWDIPGIASIAALHERAAS